MRFFKLQRDARGETRRLLFVFALTVALLVVAVNAALALAWGLTWGFWMPGALTYPRHFFAVNTGVTLLFVLGGWWVETSRLADGGGVRLGEQMGARLAQPSGNLDEQRFCNIVDEMAISSGMKRPQPMVLARDEGINAFAAGWDEDDSVVAVTQGALDHLTREELQGLVDQMRAEIEPDPAALVRALAPAILHLRPEAVEARLQPGEAADPAACEHLVQGEEVAVPAPVLEHGEHAAARRRECRQPARVGQAQRERLVHDDVPAGAQCGLGKRRMGRVRAGDHHQVDVGAQECLLRQADHLDAGQRLRQRVTPAAHHQRQLEAGRVADQRRVEDAASGAVADQCDAQRGLSHCRPPSSVGCPGRRPPRPAAA